VQICTDLASARAVVRGVPRPLVFVPTMGALHDGHVALAERAHALGPTVGASIFVNPLQFGPGEDLDRYPRPFADDCTKLEAAGVAFVYAPSAAAMYPPAFMTHVDPGAIATRFEGALRPGHFIGVATVVLKLINAVSPDVMVMGQKDAQQIAILQAMIRDFDLDVRIDVLPTVRAADGLALSSRNTYLSDADRAAAPGLYRALCVVRDGVAAGADREATLAEARRSIAAPLREAYLDVVDPVTFAPLPALAAPALAIGSAYLGTTRLLDNIAIESAA
jgi:pantoate--beta-alanine ligase